MTLVLIVDDHEMFAQSLARLLGDDPDITVIGYEATGRGAIERVRTDRPDVVIMDFQLPDIDGASATRLLLDGVCPEFS